MITLFISLVALTSQAQTKICTIDDVKKETHIYLSVYQNTGAEFVGNCLQESIAKEIQISPELQKKSSLKQIALVIEDIKQLEMGAIVKCESTNTPDCGTMAGLQDGILTKEDFTTLQKFSNIFTKEDEALLQKDADAKRANEAARHAQGLGVED
jgi:hypothetical protein